MHRVIRLYPLLTLPLLLGLSLGCETKEEGEALRFSDSGASGETDYAITGVLAEHAYLDIEVCCGEIKSVRPLDPNIIDIVSTGVSTFQVQGQSPGWAEIEVETSTGNGTVSVEVSSVAESKLHVQPWSPEFALPEELFQDGVSILPHSPVRFQATMLDANGRELIGYGLPEAVVSPEGPGTLEAHGEGQYTFRSQEEIGDAKIYFGATEFNIEVIDPARAERISLYDFGKELEQSVDQPIAMTQNTASVLHVLLRDDQGRYVIGAGNPSISVSTEEGAFSTVITGTSEDDTDPLGRSLARARALMLVPAIEGETTVDVAVAGHEVSLKCEIEGL